MNCFLFALLVCVKCDFSRFYRNHPQLESNLEDMEHFMPTNVHKRQRIAESIQRSMNEMTKRYLRKELHSEMRALMGNKMVMEHVADIKQVSQKPSSHQLVAALHIESPKNQPLRRTKWSPKKTQMPKNHVANMRKRLFLRHHLTNQKH